MSLIMAGVLFAVVAIAVTLVSGNTQSRLDGWVTSGQGPTIEDVKRITKSGDKICAIKPYQNINKMGLKEAKDALENLPELLSGYGAALYLMRYSIFCFTAKYSRAPSGLKLRDS